MGRTGAQRVNKQPKSNSNKRQMKVLNQGLNFNHYIKNASPSNTNMILKRITWPWASHFLALGLSCLHYKSTHPQGALGCFPAFTVLWISDWITPHSRLGVNVKTSFSTTACSSTFSIMLKVLGSSLLAVLFSNIEPVTLTLNILPLSDVTFSNTRGADEVWSHYRPLPGISSPPQGFPGSQQKA